jgi:hypothetical protein
MMFVVTFSILLNTDLFLVSIGQNSEISAISQLYVIAYFPALLLNGLIYLESQPLKTMFLNLMEYVQLSLVCQMFGSICHYALCWYFVVDEG